MKIQKKRRNENKTDYLKRIKLLKSGRPRICFRKTNAYLNAQYIESKEAQDKVILGLTSQKLMEYGWPKEAKGSLKSSSASYLLGILIGKKIIEKKFENPVVDFGMTKIIHKNNAFAFLNGLKDAGLKIKCDKENFPDENRIKGEHMKNKIPFEKIKSQIMNKK